MSNLLPALPQNVPIVTMLRYLTILIFCLPLQGKANFDPNIQWNIINTQHFEIIYDAKQHQLATQYANYAENAFNLLTPIFKEFPQKTVIVMDDSSDQANGFATRLPYPMIVVRPVLPEISDTIGSYGNWGYELVLHEYTHILTFEPAHGVVKPLRYIFGSVLSPNLVLPRWYLEGLAVKTESDLSEWGRLKSNSQSAAVRALTLENRFAVEDIARANEVSITEYPFGARPYLFGSLLWQKLVKEKGNDTIYNLTQRHSSRIPFIFLDTPPKDIFGNNYEVLFTQAMVDAQTIANKEIKTIENAKEFKPKEIPTEGITSSHASPSPDGTKFAYITHGHNWNNEIVIVSRKSAGSPLQSGKDRLNSITRLSWHPNSQKILYDKVGGDTDRYNVFFDIYERDLSDFKKERRITTKGRTHDPAYSPDGNQIVFVQNSPGAQSIAVIDSTGLNKKNIYTPPLQNRLAHPEYLNSEEIIFSERNQKGEEVLTVLNLKRNKFRRVLKEFSPAYKPKLTSAGLLFISEKSGVANAYLANRDLTRAEAITNTKTTISRADLDTHNNIIYMTQLTGRGTKIHEYPYDGKTKFNPPKIDKMFDIPPAKNLNEAAIDASSVKFTTEDYQSYPYMLPHYWIPFVYPLQGGALFQAMTSGNDPLNRHVYSGLYSYNTLASSQGFFLNYLNQTTNIPVVASYANYDEFILSSTVPRKNLNAFLGVQSYIYKLPKLWQLTAGWIYRQRGVQRTVTDEVFRVGPKVNLLYNGVSQKGDEISPENGQTLSLTYDHYLANPTAESRLDYEDYSLDYAYYHSKWLPARHVLYFHLKGYWANFNSTLVAGSTSSGAAYQSTLITGDFLMRGYPSGAFLGTKVGNINLEYRFPISKINKGATSISSLFSSAFAFFARRVHGRIFVDAMILDGFYFDASQVTYIQTNSQKGYSGVGAELHLDTTSFFYLPLDIYLGMYYGNDAAISGGAITPFVGISL